MKYFLETSNLSFYADGQKEILKSINWKAQKGERWVILGANGAGKSSLISSIYGLNTPTGGGIKIGTNTYGKSNWFDVRKTISLLGSQLLRSIRADELVLETVLSGESGMINYWGNYDKESLSKVKKILKQLDIEHLAFSVWAKISQGERQKVLVARSLMSKAKIIFLDEPCSALDPVARNKFLEFLDKLCQNKSIAIIATTTHHIEEITPSFTHALLMKDGEIFAQGEISKVITSANMSEAYKAECKVVKSKNKFSLKVL